MQNRKKTYFTVLEIFVKYLFVVILLLWLLIGVWNKDFFFKNICCWEHSLIENLSAVFAFLAAVNCIINIYSLVRNKTISQYKLFVGWLVLFALASIYLSGEEISWGYHLFNFDTSNTIWNEINNQQETNIHNHEDDLLRYIFAKYPRNIAIIFIFVFGSLLPFLIKNNLKKIPKILIKLLGNYDLYFHTANLILIFYITRKFAKEMGMPYLSPQWVAVQEFLEFAMAFFLFIYTFSLLPQSSKRIASQE